MEWFRWYHDTVSDVKFTTVARRAGQHRTVVIAIWAACLEAASKAEVRGSIAEMDLEDTATALDVETDTLRHVIDVFIERKLITPEKQLVKWKKRQPESDADRSKKYRKKQKITQPESAQDEQNVENVTKRHATHTNHHEASRLETDTETEKETEERSCPKLVVSDDDLATAEFISDGVRRVLPNARPPKLEAWAKEVSRMVRLDQRTHEEIRALFTWANQDAFWQTNILSPVKLHEQFDKLQLQRNRKSGLSPPTLSSTRIPSQHIAKGHERIGGIGRL